MNEVKWIKIVTDIFDDDKILLIESLPAADTIIVIWFKLLCLAGKQNNGGVFIFNDKIAYNEDMLSTIFRRDKNTVKLALDTFENFGMIERIEEVITIPNWNKHQTLDSYELKKIRDRQYQTQRREKQRKLIEKSSDKSSDKKRLIAQPSDEESLPVAFSEEEREIDIEKDNIYKYIVGYLNEKTGKAFKDVNQKTRSHINARLKEGYTVEDFKKVIDIKVAEWKGTQQDMYLRPETLFGTKFESYLNTKPTTIKPKTYQRADKTDLDGIL